MIRPIFTLLIIASMLLLPVCAKRLTDGFRLEKMKLELPYNPEWATEVQEEVTCLLNQPFTYLNKGAQSYVFVSADGQYVIKLFRFDKVPLFSPPNDFERINKANSLFSSCLLAYKHYREETGLIFLHLNLTTNKLPILHCRDALGRSYRIPLDLCRFAIQRKVQVFDQALLEASQNPDLMKKRIDSFFTLIKGRILLGIINTDANITRNFGFLGDRAVEIDFGSYRCYPGLDGKVEMARRIDKFRYWLKQNSPEWIPYFDKEIACHAGS